MQPIEANLALLERMLQELKPYLRSAEVFWPFSTSPDLPGGPFPRMTLGAVLLTLDELEALRREMTPQQATRFERLRGEWETAERKYAVALEQKAAHEYRNRFNLWKAYLADLKDSPDRAHDYAHEVRQRVMLERLSDLAPEAADIQERRPSLASLDEDLRLHFAAGDFLWDAALATRYSRQTYWFLYGRPRAES